MVADVIYISDNLVRTCDALVASGMLSSWASHTMTGQFRHGETVRVVSLINAEHHTMSIKYKRVVWDTEKQPDLRLMSVVEARCR